MREQRVADEALLGKGARDPTQAHRPVSLEHKKRIAERNAALLERRAAQVQAKRSEPEASHFEPPRRASSVGAQAYKHVESRLEESTRLYVDRTREFREDQSIASQDAS